MSWIESLKVRLALAALFAALCASVAVPAYADDDGGPFDEVHAFIDALRADEENNVADVFNHHDERFVTEGRVVVDTFTGDRVDPANLSWAQSSCTDCGSFAVAFQIVLYVPGAPVNVPENAAVALNIECLRCTTYSRAIQIVLPAEDPSAVANRAKVQLKALDARLDAVLDDVEDGDMTPEAAFAEIDVLAAEFRAIAASIEDGTLPPKQEREREARDDD